MRPTEEMQVAVEELRHAINRVERMQDEHTSNQQWAANELQVAWAAMQEVMTQ
jgi:uncharacterized protein (UPF0335 family)